MFQRFFSGDNLCSCVQFLLQLRYLYFRFLLRAQSHVIPINIRTVNIVIHVRRMQHVMEQILHVLMDGIKTAEYVNIARLKMRLVQDQMIMFAGRGIMMKMASVMHAQKMQHAMVGMNIFIVILVIISIKVHVSLVPGIYVMVIK